MAARLTIDTHGGISAVQDFVISVKPEKTFTLEVHGIRTVYKAIEYTGQENRQCYKCAFCHQVDLCVHFECKRGKMIKFKTLN